MFAAKNDNCVFVTEYNNKKYVYEAVNCNSKTVNKIAKYDSEIDFYTYTAGLFYTYEKSFTFDAQIIIRPSNNNYSKHIKVYKNGNVYEPSQYDNFTKIISDKIFDPDNLATLNGHPVKKVCVGIGNCYDAVLTTSGQVFVISNFNSSVNHDYLDMTQDDNDVKIIDIDCTKNINDRTVVALSNTGCIYKIVQKVSEHGDVDAENQVKIGSNVKAISCSFNKIFFQKFTGELFVDSEQQKVVVPDNINIDKFVCTTNHLVVQSNNQLYTCSIDTDSDIHNLKFEYLANLSN